MPFNAFTQPDNFSITGPVNIGNDPNSGAVGSVSIAGRLSGGVVAPTTSTGGTLAVTGARVIKATVASGAQATNLTLASGLPGQELTVINENTTGTSTLIITGSVITVSGTTTVTISGLAGKRFIFDDTQGLWVNV
jgi:hypothetical protein